MNPGRISFFVTNFADETGGNVHVAVLPAQLRGDLLGPGTDAAVDFRIEGLAREKQIDNGFFVGLLLGDALCRSHWRSPGSGARLAVIQPEEEDEGTRRGDHRSF